MASMKRDGTSGRRNEELPESDSETRPSERASEPDEIQRPGASRRGFLAGVGGVTGAALVGGIPVLFGSRPAAASHRGHHGWRRFSRLHWRRKKSFQIRLDAAYDELYRPIVPHRTNGDEERYPNRIGNFSKTLPHDECGEVDRDAYRALLHALNTNRFDDFEAVPKGGTGNYLNPMGGTVFSIDGPDTAAIGIEPPPPFASPELAAQAAEVYWMALLRDVPLTAWDSDPLVGEAVDDLARFSGYEGPPLSRQNLFRLDYPGVLDGPMVSQFCWRPGRERPRLLRQDRGRGSLHLRPARPGAGRGPGLDLLPVLQGRAHHQRPVRLRRR
jgi:hypothetical protein